MATLTVPNPRRANQPTGPGLNGLRSADQASPRLPRADPDAVPLAEYVRRTRRAAPLVIAGAGLGILAGLGLVRVTPRVHQASTSVLIADAPVLISGLSPSRDRTRLFTMDTEAQRVQAGPVPAAVRAATGPGLIRLTVSALPNTTTLRITVTAKTSRSALAGARTAAAAYLAERGSMLAARQSARLAALGTDLQTLRAEAKQVDGERDDALVAARSAAIAAQVRRDQSMIALVRGASTDPGTVVEQATSPPARRHNPTVPPASGLVLGAALGAALAGRRTIRLRTGPEISRLLPGLVITELRPDTPLWLEPLAGDLLLRLGAGHHVIAVAPIDAATCGQAPHVAQAIALTLTRLTPDVAFVPGQVLGSLDLGSIAAQGLLDTTTLTYRPAGDGRVLRDLARIRAQATISVIAAPAPQTPDGALLAGTADGVLLVLARGCPQPVLLAAVHTVRQAGGRLLGVQLVDQRRGWRQWTGRTRPRPDDSGGDQ